MEERNSERRKARGIFLAVTGAVMWGIMGIFVRNLSAMGYSSYDISFLRCLLAGTCFLILKAVTDPRVLRIDFKGLCICFLYGISAYAIGFVAYGIAVDRIPVAVATVLMFMSPIWVALLGVVVFREKLKKETGLIIIICIIGAALVANVFGATDGKMDMAGVLAGVINGFGVALQIMIPRYFAKKYERDTMLVYGFLGAALGLSFLTDFKTIAHSFQMGATAQVVVSLFGIGILCTMVANVSFVKASIYIPTVTCSILSALEVVVGAAVGFIMFQEHMTPLQMIGAVVVVLGSLGPAVFKRKHSEEGMGTAVT